MKNIQRNSLLALLLAASFVGATKTMDPEVESLTATEPVTTSATASATNVTAQQVENYIAMEKNHKAAWLDYMKTTHDKKFDLMKKHANEWADFHINMLKQHDLKAMQQPDFLSKKLTKMIALHEKQRQEWHDLCKNNYEAAKQLYEQEGQQLNSFKQSVGLPVTAAVTPTAGTPAAMGNIDVNALGEKAQAYVGEKAKELQQRIGEQTKTIGQKFMDWLNKPASE